MKPVKDTNDYHAFRLKMNGLQFLFRPVKPSDKELFQKGFSQLSDWSKYFRFFSITSELNENQLKYFTEVDAINHVAWGILLETEEGVHPIGVGRFVKLEEEENVAELALSVVDAYQRKGIGRILFLVLNIIAYDLGIRRFRHNVISENDFVLHSIKNFDVVNKKRDGSVYTFDTRLIPNYMAIPDGPGMEKDRKRMQDIDEKIRGISSDDV